METFHTELHAAVNMPCIVVHAATAAAAVSLYQLPTVLFYQ